MIISKTFELKADSTDKFELTGREVFEIDLIDIRSNIGKLEIGNIIVAGADCFSYYNGCCRHENPRGIAHEKFLRFSSIAKGLHVGTSHGQGISIRVANHSTENSQLNFSVYGKFVEGIEKENNNFSGTTNSYFISKDNSIKIFRGREGAKSIKGAKFFSYKPFTITGIKNHFTEREFNMKIWSENNFIEFPNLNVGKFSFDYPVEIFLEKPDDSIVYSDITLKV